MTIKEFFTQENTEGYSEAELKAFNAELNQLLADIDLDDLRAVEAATKAFADEVSRR